MAEIKYQRPGDSPEISSTSIHIPDDADMGTGTFTVVFTPAVSTAAKVIASGIVQPPVFQISATVNPNGQVPVLLGTAADYSPPKDRVVFRLPASLGKASHSLRIDFANWRITAASLDGQRLSAVPQPKLN